MKQLFLSLIMFLSFIIVSTAHAVCVGQTRCYDCVNNVCTDVVVGGGGCDDNFGMCQPSGCDCGCSEGDNCHDTEPDPTDPPLSCSCSSWEDAGCVGGRMSQTRSCAEPPGCYPEYRTIVDPLCALPPTPTDGPSPTPNPTPVCSLSCSTGDTPAENCLLDAVTSSLAIGLGLSATDSGGGAGLSSSSLEYTNNPGTLACSGTASACTSMSTQGTCEAQSGCSWSSTCGGTLDACSTFGPVNCLSQYGCGWVGFSCTSTIPIASCSGIDSTNCVNRSTCSLVGGCTGTSAPCASFDTSSCTSQSGCVVSDSSVWQSVSDFPKSISGVSYGDAVSYIGIENTTYKFRYSATDSGSASCPVLYSGDIMIIPGASILGTIQARSALTSRLADCSVFDGSTDPLATTQFSLSNGLLPQINPESQTQTGNDPVMWSNVVTDTGVYYLSAIPPVNYSPNSVCCSLNGGANAPCELYESLADGDTLVWNLGYALSGPWYQAVGGDVMAGGDITVGVPEDIENRYFIRSSTDSNGGLAVYGASYDFSIETGNTGDTLVSPLNYKVQDASLPFAASSWSWYDYFDTMTDKSKVKTELDPQEAGDFLLSHLGTPAADTPYYINGSVTISQPWSIPSGQKYVVFVSGDLTIGNTITRADPKTGFIGFVVNGDITIDPSVGVAYTSETPVLEGLFAANGVFHTGGSTNPTTERLVGKGLFIADSFDFNRDLGDIEEVDQNQTTAGELFIYDPSLPFTIPSYANKSTVRREEVKP